MIDLTGQLTEQYLEIYRDYFKSVENIGYYIHDEVSLIENLHTGLGHTGTGMKQ